MKTIGIIILILGILMSVITGFNVITREKVLDLGAVEINKENKTPVYWSPVTGGVLVVTGLVILGFSRKKAS